MAAGERGRGYGKALPAVLTPTLEKPKTTIRILEAIRGGQEARTYTEAMPAILSPHRVFIFSTLRITTGGPRKLK